MKKSILSSSIALAIISLTACIGNVKNISMEDLPPEHRWNEGEIRILKSLSLYNISNKQDISNRVVNNSDAIALGKALFFDKRFSANGNIACASCHKPELYFTDGLAQARGISQTKRNTPTIVGASQNTWFFLDGRTDSLWAQAMEPLENALEHGSSRNQFAHEIYNNKELRIDYEKVYGPMPNISDTTRFPYHAGPIKKDRTANRAWRTMNKKDQKIITDIFVNGAKTIAAYETTLQPKPSRFDNYVEALAKKDSDTMISKLSIQEAAGLKVFLGEGKCMICHNGPMFSDSEFHNIGTPPLNVKKYDFGRSKGVSRVKKNPFNCLSDYNDDEAKTCDELKYIVTHDEETRGAFKTPSLRNVSKTAPYMHGGQYKKLSEVLQHYNKPPSTKIGMSDLLDIDLSKKELMQLEKFLLSLNSDISYQ